MSHGGGAAGSTGGVTRSGALSEIIDLTEGDAEEAVPQPPPAQHMFEEMMQQDDSNARATEGNSRAQRPPRFGRNIIAIDDSSDDEERRTSAARTTMRENGHPPRPQFAGLRRPGHVRQPSPPMAETEDFEITGERTASRPQTMSRQPTPNMALPRSFTPLPGQAAVDLTQDDDDDVVHVNTTTRDNGVNAGGPIQFGGYRAAAPDPVHPPRRRFGFGEIGDLLHPGHLRNHIMRRMGVGSAATRNEELEERALHEAAIGRQTNRHEGHRHHHHHHHHHAHGNGHHHHHHQRPHLGDLRGAVQHFGIDIATRQRERREDATMRLDFGMGIGMMDYEEVAFDMGLGGNRPASPEYKAPGDAKEGFTRSPREDEEVVCPNCGDELAVGDGDLKQQVWVVKSCGHVSCMTFSLMSAQCVANNTAGLLWRVRRETQCFEEPQG